MTKTALEFPVSIAPMMDYSDRHFRMLMRFITKHTILYTEMVSTGAILYGDRDRHLAFSQKEKPLVLQVGGNNPKELAECTRIAADYGYDEINLNAGCPSDRVQHGAFGAVLMANPQHTATMVKAMCDTHTIPISVKCRIGIDGSAIGLPVKTSYKDLVEFAHAVFDAGATRLVVHARIAILGGLSPKENRNIPPLQYPLVYTLAQDFPKHRVEINGGIVNLQGIETHLNYVQGAMLGRVAVDMPMLFRTIDHHFATPISTSHNKIDIQKELLDRLYIIEQYCDYLHSIQHTVYTHNAIRHILPFFNGLRGAKKWRQSISSILQSGGEPHKVHQFIPQYKQIMA